MLRAECLKGGLIEVLRKSVMVEKLVQWISCGFDGSDGSSVYSEYLPVIQKAMRKDFSRDSYLEVKRKYLDIKEKVKASGQYDKEDEE